MNTPTEQTTPAVLAARAEASAWITRLHGPNRSPEMEAGFRRWLQERPENGREFEGLTEVWELVAGGTPVRGAPRLERWEHSAESQELQALRRLKGSRATGSTRIWARAALILLTCTVVAAGAYRFWPAPPYVTGIGEQRVVQLTDGTRVSLNSNSRLEVSYSESGRRARLDHGEAFFEVARDARRPFVVTAGEHQVTALGTSFVVRYDSERTAITLVDGKVSVDTLKGADPAAVTYLTPGKRLTLVKRAPPRLDAPRIEAVTAWRRGEVMLNDTPLVEAVAEMNRYDATAIVIDSPEIGDLAVSGLYHTGDSEGFAHSIARMYRLQITESRDGIHLGPGAMKQE